MKRLRVSHAVVLILCCCTGCGGVSASSADGAAQVDSLSTADAAISIDGALTPRCDPSAPFEPAVPLVALNTPEAEDEARLSPDELTIYYSAYHSDGVGDWDIYVATRGSLLAEFQAPVLLHGPANTAGMERGPTVTADGLFLYADTFATDYDLSFAQRGDPTTDFGAMQLAAGINSSGVDGDPYVLPDHGALYFTRAPGEVGQDDIYRAPRIGGVFGTPLPVSGIQLNTADREGAPVVMQDELTIYFASGRSGNFDMYVATRSTRGDGFGVPEPLTSLNTSETDFPTWISSDGCVLYFTRYSPATHYDLYVARRSL